MSDLSARTTTAYVLEALGYDGLHRRTRALPLPPPGHVTLRMRAASLNFRDLKILKGVYARAPKLPLVPLSDGAGEIVQVGSGVTSVQLGAGVIPVYMQGWYDGPMSSGREGWMSRGGDIDGTAQEYLVCHERDVVPIPTSLSYAEAACLPCAAVTAWHAIMSVGCLKAGESVLVMGSGGVSVFALQFAKIHGARVIATSRHAAKARRLAALGASHTIDTSVTPDWDAEVLNLTGGRGVDHVVEVGGEGTIARSLRATRDGGQIHVIGDLTGAFPAKAPGPRGITIRTITVGSRAMLQSVIDTIDTHREMPVIDRSFAFADLPAALKCLELGDHFGKIVVAF